jgi:hypothetical protein
MYGPEPPGRLTKSAHATAFQHLTPGALYVVAVAFTDHDGDVHPVGESWTFLAHQFVPYDDGLSLVVSLDGHREWQIRLQWRPEAQGAIIDDLARLIRPRAA